MTLRTVAAEMSTPWRRVMVREPTASPHTAAALGPIVVIFLENHSYSQIIGNSCCPYLNAQAKKERQHFRDRKLLMQYEKQRAEMRKNMGLNPVLG